MIQQGPENRFVSSEAAWRADQQSDPTKWTVHLTRDDKQEVLSALERARRIGASLATLRREDFPLPTVSAKIRQWAKELADGRGFALIRGFPVDGLSPEDAGLAYYGLGLHLGTPVPQNKNGDLLGHVRDLGIPRTSPAVRLYTTRERQDFHTDGADVIGLLCLKKAKRGGESQLASSISVYNEISRRRPDLAKLLFEPMYWDRNDEQGPGEPPFYALPICADVSGKLRFFYIGWYIRDAQRHPEVPRLRGDQIQLLDLIESIANDPAFCIEMDFEVGDIQLLNNAVMLHARNAYEDFAEPERRRHLLRLWLTAHDFRSVDGLLLGGIPKREA